MAEIYEIAAAVAPMREAPSRDATQVTQALFGERAAIDEVKDGWGMGRLEGDGYAGWLPMDALRKAALEPTHKVAALSTLAFPGPSIKLPPAMALPFAARVAIARHEGTFAITPDGWHLPARHLSTIDSFESDFAGVAERFLNAPYLWGGKTHLGLDCSGLVQVSLNACGTASPRDSGPQEKALGTALSKDAKLTRGDLIFWKGHVAIVRDDRTMIHANAFHMCVAIEGIAEGIARIAASGSDVTSVKRLETPCRSPSRG